MIEVIKLQKMFLVFNSSVPALTFKLSEFNVAAANGCLLCEYPVHPWEMH